MRVYKLTYDLLDGAGGVDTTVVWFGSKREAKKHIAVAKRTGEVGDGRYADIECVDIPNRKPQLINWLNFFYGGNQ
jgi:hypothetical protein